MVEMMQKLGSDLSTEDPVSVKESETQLQVIFCYTNMYRSIL